MSVVAADEPAGKTAAFSDPLSKELRRSLIKSHRNSDKRSPLPPARGGKRDTCNFPDQRTSVFQVSLRRGGYFWLCETESVVAF